jgi:voltage-gated potassium channel
VVLCSTTQGGSKGLKAMLDYLHGALHRSEHPAYALVQTVVWVLIFLSLVLLGWEQGMGLEHDSIAWFETIDRLVLLLFGFEVSLRILTFRPPATQFYDIPPWKRLKVEVVERLRFCLQPFNFIDLLTLLAVYPALRGLRALRLLQLLRTTSFFRYSRPVHGTMQAFRDNALLFSMAFGMLGLGTLVGGFSLFLIEGRINPDITSLGDGLWWALVTLTTVGFGDIAPITGLGRIVGSVMMVIGMFSLALFAGIVGTTLLRAFISLREDQFRMSNDVGHLVICGYDPGSRMLLNTVLKEVGSLEIDLVIFASGERPNDIPPNFRWISGDATKESELNKARLAQARAVIIVGMRSMEPQAADAISILTAFTIRSYMKKALDSAEFERVQPLYVVTEVLDSENVQHAHAAGCDEVIETNALGFSMLSHSIFQHGTGHVMSMIGSSGQQSLWVGEIPEDVEFPVNFGTISHQIKEATGAMVIGIQIGPGMEEVLNPDDTRQLEHGTHLIYLAVESVLKEVDEVIVDGALA